jgi:hypothetical protein
MAEEIDRPGSTSAEVHILFNKRAKESPAFKHGEELAQIFTSFILDISYEQ